METKLKEMNLELPAVPAPAGNYVPWVRVGNLVYLAGTLPVMHGEITHKGKVGEVQTVEAGYQAAKMCALNSIAVLKHAIGDLGKVKRWVLVNGFVNGVAGFADSPAVLNGASDLLGQLFGEAGKHARAAVAVAGLPKDATVEIQCVVEVTE